MIAGACGGLTPHVQVRLSASNTAGHDLLVADGGASFRRLSGSSSAPSLLPSAAAASRARFLPVRIQNISTRKTKEQHTFCESSGFAVK